MDTNTNWIKNLDAIYTCKENIKTALENKGVDMTDVAFASYYEKINALQLESGDSDTPSEPSTPTPSVEYIYSNGYLTNGTETNEITNIVPYEIVLDDNGECIFEITTPREYRIYDGGYDIVFTFEVPEKYTITKFVWIDEANDNEEKPQDYKANPRYTTGTITRNGVVYYSYTRNPADGLDIKSKKLYTTPIKHIIIIKERV